MTKKILKVFLSRLKKILYFWASNIEVEELQKKVHIIRSDTIGDFVLFSAILPYFKKIYLGYKVVLIGDAVWRELALWLQENRILGGKENYFDELISINGKFYSRSPFYYYKILKKLRLSAPEIVLQPTFSRTEKSDEWVLISREARKIGYYGDLSNIQKSRKERNDKKYSRLIGNPQSRLESEKNKHFLNEVAGYKVLASGLPQWKLPETLLTEGRSFLQSFGLNLSKPIIAVFPSASAPIRRWPLEKFASLLLMLSQYNTSLQFVLIGGPRDEKVSSQLANSKEMQGLPVYNLSGKTKLPELAKLLSLASLYIGNETGALHMASAVGTSTVCLLGGGHYGRFFPYPAWKEGAENIAVTHKMDCFNCNWKCQYKTKKGETVPCIKNIKVDEVYNQAIRVLPAQSP